MTKLSEAESAAAVALAAAAGQTRSEWLRALIAAKVAEADGTRAFVAEVEAQNARIRRDDAQARKRSRSPAAQPGGTKPRRCPHPGTRSTGGWCAPCGVRVLPGGLLPG